MPTVFVREVMRFIKHHQIGIHAAPAAQGIEKLIAIDLSGADDQWGIRIVFSIPGEDAYLLRAELCAELLVLGICQGLEWAGVPGTPAGGQQSSDLFAGDPG